MSGHKPNSINTKHGIPITDVVPRPPNGGRMVMVHEPLSTDYDETGLAFGRPGAGAPILDYLNPTEIYAKIRSVHTVPKRSSNVRFS